jgi:hypothetical protein
MYSGNEGQSMKQTFNENWDLSTIPDDKLKSERGRRNAARVKNPGGKRAGAGRKRVNTAKELTNEEVLRAVLLFERRCVGQLVNLCPSTSRVVERENT